METTLFQIKTTLMLFVATLFEYKTIYNMATFKLVLIKEQKNKEDKSPVRLRFAANSLKADVNLDVFINQSNWDAKEMFILQTEKGYVDKNMLIREAYEKAKDMMKELKKRNRVVEDAIRLRALYNKEEESVLFLDRLKALAERRDGKTRETYLHTWNRIKAFTNQNIYFDDINQTWLETFDMWCKKEGNSINTRGIHFRNMRAVFNGAINDKVISADIYPFKAFKIEVGDVEKRTLTITEFKKLLAYSGSLQENWARDVFVLSFYMLGINMKDLFYLKEVFENEIAYNRHKTHKRFNVALEPETLVLIERYKGTDMLLNFSNTIKNHENFNKKVNRYLRIIATKINDKEANNKSEWRMREFTTYAARHSWATFAGQLEIAGTTISMGMGHMSTGNTTTDRYIQFNHPLVIKANRQVVDYVLGK